MILTVLFAVILNLVVYTPIAYLISYKNDIAVVCGLTFLLIIIAANLYFFKYILKELKQILNSKKQNEKSE